MTTMQELDTLHRAARLQYDHKQQSFRTLVEKEHQLRAELARLDDLLANSLLPIEEHEGMRAVGADILWQGWIERAKSEINMKLARILATKERQMTEVRRAFGRKSALEQLISSANRENAMARANADLAQAIDHTLFQNRGTSGQDAKPIK